MDMEDTSKLKIFTGTAHLALAKEISDYIGVPLGKAICGRFNNGEIQVMINESVRGKDCFIIQPTGAPVNDNLMEMLIMLMRSRELLHATSLLLFHIMDMLVRTARQEAVNRSAPSWLPISCLLPA